MLSNGQVFLQDLQINTVRSMTFQYFEEEYKIFTPDKIKEVKFYPPATKVTFKDGTVVTTTAQEGDEFDEYTGIMTCIMEYIFKGKTYNNMIRRWIKKAREEEEAKEKVLKKAEEEKKVREHQKKKKIAKKLLKKQAYIEEQIEIQKEAYLRAMKEKEQVSAEENEQVLEEEKEQEQ